MLRAGSFSKYKPIWMQGEKNWMTHQMIFRRIGLRVVRSFIRLCFCAMASDTMRETVMFHNKLNHLRYKFEYTKSWVQIRLCILLRLLWFWDNLSFVQKMISWATQLPDRCSLWPTQSHSLNVQERRLVRVLWRAVVTRRVSFSFINGRKELSTDCNVFQSAAVFDVQGSTASVHVGGS